MRLKAKYFVTLISAFLILPTGPAAQERAKPAAAVVTRLEGFAAIQPYGELLWRDLRLDVDLARNDQVRTDLSSNIGATFPGGGRVLGASVSYFEITSLPLRDGSGTAGVKNLYGTVLMVPPRDSLTYSTFLVIAQTDTIVGREGMFTNTITDKGEVIVTAVTGSVILRRGASGRTIYINAPGRLTLKPGDEAAEPSDLDPQDMQAIGDWAEGGPPWKPSETVIAGRKTWAYFLERQQAVWQRDPQIYLRLHGSFSEAAGEFILWNGVRNSTQTEAGKGYFFIQEDKAVVEIEGTVP